MAPPRYSPSAFARISSVSPGIIICILRCQLTVVHSSTVSDLLRTFTISSVAVQEAQLAFISLQGSSSTFSLKLRAAEIARLGTNSGVASIRVLACTVLGAPANRSRGASWHEAARLMKDEDEMVRAAAARALGLIVKTGLVESVRSRLFSVSLIPALSS